MEAEAAARNRRRVTIEFKITDDRPGVRGRICAKQHRRSCLVRKRLLKTISPLASGCESGTRIGRSGIVEQAVPPRFGGSALPAGGRNNPVHAGVQHHLTVVIEAMPHRCIPHVHTRPVRSSKRRLHQLEHVGFGEGPSGLVGIGECALQKLNDLLFGLSGLRSVSRPRYRRAAFQPSPRRPRCRRRLHKVLNLGYQMCARL